MEAEEKKRFDDMETNIEKIEKTVEIIKTALLGNEFSGEEGFKGQIRFLREELITVKAEIKTLREERVENKVYILIIKVLLATLLAAGLGYMFAK